MSPKLVQKEKTSTATKTEEVEEIDVPAQEHHDELDALLDEIDTVLEENAQQFVAEYIQKGGE